MGPRNPKMTWFLTYPQSDVPTRAHLLEHLKSIDNIIEYVVATEKHQDGNVHYHAYVKYETGVVLADAPRKFTVPGCKSGNYQPARSAKAVMKYCTKEDDYESNFDVSSYLNKKKKLSIETIKTKSAKQALIDGDITIASIRNYNLARSIIIDPYEHDTVRGFWIYGPPGSGKSHAARVAYPDAYMKPQNKWFDGYEGQKTIVLEDLDTPTLGHYLKIWTDRWSCSGEVKGGTTQLCHERFIITSNYSPEELFKDDPVMAEAVARRCEIIYKDSQDLPVGFVRST